MKAIISIFLIAGISILASACSKDKTTTTPEIKQLSFTEKQKQLISTSNAFGFDFFRNVNEISGTSANMMVSPLSVSMALGMTRNGAAGTTLEAMTNTLGFSGLSDADINESYKTILQTFTTLDTKVKLQIANSIWYRNTFHVEQPFVLTNKQYFDASVTALDFTSTTAVDVINAWVNEKTNQLIPTILEEIASDAVMYLVNAVYFKGEWKYQFDKDKTEPKTFTLADGSGIQVPTMTEHATFPYYKGDGFEVVELPYNQGNYVMDVLLPAAGKSVGDVIGQLSQQNWNVWSRQFNDKDIQLQLPKFKYEYSEKGMIPILTAMGMEVAFNPDQADFTRINSGGGLYISDVKHKTFISTDEEGSEAAAVTSVGVGTTSVGVDQPYYFMANRPFVYFIREKSSGTILFIGTVMNPILEN